MRSKVLVALLAIIFMAGCKKDNGTTTARIEVTVQSATQTALVGKAVQLLSDESSITVFPVAEAQSNGIGKVDFNVIVGKTYYLYHYNSDSKTLIDANATYIITGKFTSEFEINSSPTQTPAAKIGDDIHQDINGDGKIDKNDMVIKVMATNPGSTTNVNFVLN